MIVKVQDGEYFPADLLLLKCSEAKGMCYVETKNLDGETNLKHKLVDKSLNHNISELTNIDTQLVGTLLCEAPND
jgi:P-type E1-E2 ATPase